MFDPRSEEGQGRIFKLAKGDGFPVRTPGFGIVLLTTVQPAAASKIFAEALPPELTSFISLQCD